MKAGASSRGYTIIEVMIFLAISTSLLAIAYTFIGGQNQANQFGLALRNMESKILDMVNTVSSGTYTYQKNISCNVVGGGLTFTTVGGTNHGTNQNCVFIGRIIQFSPQTPGDNGYNIFTIAGRRFDSSSNEVQRLDDAYPTAVATPAVDLTDSETMGYGLKVTKVVTADSSHQDIAGIGFISEFAHSSNASTTDLFSGAQTANLVGPAGGLNQDTPTFVNTIKALNEADRARGQNGAIICFADDGGRRGAITINSQGVTDVLIDTLDQTVGAGVCP